MNIYTDYDGLRLDLGGISVPLSHSQLDDLDDIEIVELLRDACEDWLERELKK